MTVPRVQQHLTPFVLDHIYKWANNNEYNEECRFKKRDSGVDALWIPIDDKYGIKVYKYRDKAMWSFHVGRILYHFDCSPHNHNFTTITYCGKTYYAFIQERCDILGKMFDFGNCHCGCTYSADCCCCDDDEPDEAYIIRDELELKIAETPFYSADDHIWNIGINRFGDGVYVDIGHFGINDF